MSVGSEDEISVGLECYVENNTRLCIIFLVFIIFEYIIEHFLHEFFGVIKGDKNERKSMVSILLVDEEGLQVCLSFLKPSYTKTPPVTISITLVQ